MAEEDFIDMELTSSSSPQLKDFEFQCFCTSTPKESAADLFYKGKLLPLHHLPRRHFVEHLTGTNSNAPSCTISRCDLNPKNTHTPSSWSKKLKTKLNKHSYLAHKLRSSRAFLKSFFTKEHSSSSSTLRFAAAKFRKNGIVTDDRRRSFSGAIAADSATNGSSSSSSSSSSSFNSMSGVHEMQFLRRSTSDAEIEVSIDAAIAHCKKSFGIHCNFSP